MTTAKNFVCIFALLLLTGYCQQSNKPNTSEQINVTQPGNITWNNSAFSVAPALILSLQSRLIDYTTALVINFGAGPLNETNLLMIAAGSDEDDQDEEYHILNATDLDDELEYLNLNAKHSLQSVRIASTTDGLVITVYQAVDSNQTSQLFYTVASGEDLLPKVFLVSNNTELNSIYTVEELIVNETSPVLIFSKRVNDTNVTLYAGNIKVGENTLSNVVTLNSGNYSNVTCDVNFTTLLCVFESNETLYRALISNSKPAIGALFQDNLNTTYVLEEVQNCDGYFIIVLSNSSANDTDLSVIVVNTSVVESNFSLKENDVKTLTKLKGSNATASPYVDSVPFYDGFGILYSSIEDNGVRGWYYDLFNKDASHNESKMLIATVPADPIVSELYVSNEFGVGAINILAYSIAPFNETSTVPIYYGQLFSQTIAGANITANKNE